MLHGVTPEKQEEGALRIASALAIASLVVEYEIAMPYKWYELTCFALLPRPDQETKALLDLHMVKEYHFPQGKE